MNLLDANDNIIRTKLADQLCEHFGFFDPRGDKQRAGCLKALRELEQDGRLILPQSSSKLGKRSPRRLAQPVPAPQGVPAEAGQIRGLRLIAVEGEDDMRTWNELMIQDHPRGAGLLVGRQIRYLVGSEHGWLGFGNATSQFAPRSQYEPISDSFQRIMSKSCFSIAWHGH